MITASHVNELVASLYIRRQATRVSAMSSFASKVSGFMARTFVAVTLWV